MGDANKPAEDPVTQADFQRVIRHFVTTPHKPHESINKASDKAAPNKRKEPSKKTTQKS
jgi:hypothetical protein